MASYPATILADNPILYLRLQEPSGASCADSSTNGFTGTAHGTFTRNVAEAPAGITPGVTLGGAITDYISVPDNAALDIVGAPFTYECWINPASLAATSVLMAKGHSNVSPGGYGLLLVSTGALKMQNQFDGSLIIQTGPAQITAGSLFHIVVARDSVGGTATIYINSVNITAGSSGFTTIATNEPFTVGATSNNGTIANPFSGTIDEVAVYTTSLNQSQVSAHYAARNTPATTGQGQKNAPGQTVQALVHERNAERKDSPHPQRHRISAYRRKRGTGFV